MTKPTNPTNPKVTPITSKQAANSQTGGTEQSHPEGPVFNVNSIYVKDISFESPNVPALFNEEWKPKVDFDLQMASHVMDEEKGLYEVTLHVTVTVKLLDKETTCFLTEVNQAGIFVIHGFEPEIIKQILSTACPTVLFPYARETITSLISRGGFPQLLLPPINFDAMYAQHLEKAADKNKEKGKS